MILKALGKLSISGGIVSGAVLVDSFGQGVSKDIQKKIEKEETEIKTVEDIELFEKINGCRFVYVKDGKNKVLYGARQFIEEESKQPSDTNGNDKVVKGRYLNLTKQGCKDKKGILTLFYSNEHKAFSLTEPPSGG